MQQKIFLPISFIILLSVAAITTATYTTGRNVVQSLVEKRLQDSADSIVEAMAVMQSVLLSQEFDQKLEYRLQAQRADFKRMGLDLEQFFLDREGRVRAFPDSKSGGTGLPQDPSLLRRIAARLHGIDRFSRNGSRYTIAYAFSPERQLIYAVALREDQYLRPVSRMRQLTLGLGIGSLLLTFATTLLVARGVTGPIRRLAILIKEMEGGNFALRAEERGAGPEIGKLNAGLNLMLGKIGEMLRGVQATTRELSRSGELLAGDADRARVSMRQIAAATETLASAAREQAVVSLETSAALNRIESSVGRIARKIDQAAEDSRIMKGDAAVAQASFAGVMRQMREIQEVSGTAISVVRDLAARSSEIGRIVELIDGVAKQTKLLALNAAIEAARAGEHGKGFAVVAGEIRKLSESTVESTRAIAELLGLVGAGALRAEQMSNRVGQVVAEGVTAGDEAEQAFQKIFEGIARADAHVREILAESGEILLAIEDMKQAMDTLVRDSEMAVEGTGRIAEETAVQQAHIEKVSNSATFLVDLAERLKKQTDRFTVPAS